MISAMNGLTEVVQANISDVNQHLSTSLNSTMNGKGPDKIDRVFEQTRAMSFLGDFYTKKMLLIVEVYWGFD